MKKHLFLLAGLIFSEQVFAQSNVGSGPLFTVTGNGMYLNISTNIPNTSYQNAGIHINTAGVSPMTCNTAGNGYCFFSVSDTQPEYFLTQGSAGSVSMTLCLDARDQTNNCEKHTAITNTPTPPNFTNTTVNIDDPFNSYTDYTGTNFIPTLGPTSGSSVQIYTYSWGSDPAPVNCNNQTMSPAGTATLESINIAREAGIPVPGGICIALCNINFTGTYLANNPSSLCTNPQYYPDGPPVS